MTYANPEALVETDWLAEHLQDPTVAIIEVDEDTEAFAGGHIPGAVPLDWKTELAAAPRRDFIAAADLAPLLASKGISDQQQIVLAILRREMGVMATSALVVAALGVRAAGWP